MRRIDCFSMRRIDSFSTRRIDSFSMRRIDSFSIRRIDSFSIRRNDALSMCRNDDDDLSIRRNDDLSIRRNDALSIRRNDALSIRRNNGFSMCGMSLLLLLLLIPSALLPSCGAVSHAFLPLKLVTDASSDPAPVQTILTYHHGSLLSGLSPINLYLIWYGNFSTAQKSIITDFLSSFSQPLDSAISVSSWWHTTSLYKDKRHSPVSPSLHVQTETNSSDAYSLGKILQKDDIGRIVQQALASGAFPSDSAALYLVLTSDDVYVDEFCTSSCGFHDHFRPSHAVKGHRLVYAWIGNPGKQCPGQCAWPFAAPEFGPPAVLISPNGDVGVDGMVINIATLLAGAATNPLDNGYFQGDPRLPTEAVSACTGIFGQGAYPGYPGALAVDGTSGASYNVHGIKNRLFLLPAMWNPSVLACTPVA